VAQAAQRQQELVVLRLEAGVSGELLTQVEERAQPATKNSQGAVVTLAEIVLHL
jgi:hypothetical protein